MSLGIEVRGEDLTVALQAEELTLQQLGTVGLWQFLHGQCPGEDGGIAGELVGFFWGIHSLTCSCHCAPRAATLVPSPWRFSPAAIRGRKKSNEVSLQGASQSSFWGFVLSRLVCVLTSQVLLMLIHEDCVHFFVRLLTSSYI